MAKTRYVGVVVLLVACAVSSCSGDDNKSSSNSDPLSTDAMVPAIRSIIAIGGGTTAATADLNLCPLGDFDTLVARGPSDLQALTTPDDQLFAYVYQPKDAAEKPHLQCGRGNLGVYTGEAPDGDYREDLTQILADFVVNFDPDRAFRGGTIVRFCTGEIGVGTADFCEADWYDNNVWVGVFMQGDVRSAELAEQWLLAVLDDVVASVPQLATSIQLAA